jgi:hypothetical protein
MCYWRGIPHLNVESLACIGDIRIAGRDFSGISGYDTAVLEGDARWVKTDQANEVHSVRDRSLTPIQTGCHSLAWLDARSCRISDVERTKCEWFPQASTGGWRD